jgi:uncharacterized membrane protein
VIRVSTLGRLLLAGGVSGAAVIGLITHAFVRNWEPVPAGLPLFGSAVWVSGLVLLACGACLLVPRAAPSAAVALSLTMAIWIVILHAPLIAAHPEALVHWGYSSGVLSVGSGALALWTLLAARSVSKAARERWRVTARMSMGPALIVFGISHLLFAPNMTVLVPVFLPWKVQIIQATGLAHIAAGTALICGMAARPAALLEATMMSSFVLAVDIPRFLAGRVHGPPWAIAFETAMTGAVWCVAAALRREPVRSAPGCARGRSGLRASSARALPNSKVAAARPSPGAPASGN